MGFGWRVGGWGAFGFNNPECGRQTGLHTTVLSMVEPVVNSGVVKAE